MQSKSSSISKSKETTYLADEAVVAAAAVERARARRRAVPVRAPAPAVALVLVMRADPTRVHKSTATRAALGKVLIAQAAFADGPPKLMMIIIIALTASELH